jgi:hypothetical protein
MIGIEPEHQDGIFMARSRVLPERPVLFEIEWIHGLDVWRILSLNQATFRERAYPRRSSWLFPRLSSREL